jgi:hypothetical protein
MHESANVELKHPQPTGEPRPRVALAYNPNKLPSATSPPGTLHPKFGNVVQRKNISPPAHWESCTSQIHDIATLEKHNESLPSACKAHRYRNHHMTPMRHH